ncbi:MULTISPECIES: hypothetical protein [Flavobacterium]|uniref:hypothetical protein n=1 Tax=Flavobacterium TaxID=237 RepID=UPI001FCC92AD|nr:MULTISPECIES: hypothetical protein [Flavobacterium]UOK41602.1 hypothetical protein LZF87_09795 [Flavobacterium enshiense]
MIKSEIENNWIDIDNGNTIGTLGSEGGEIIVDIENIDGARITLEKECGTIPFAITFGIYGLMFHTHFENDLSSSKEYIELKKIQMNKVFKLYEVQEEERDDDWWDKHSELMDLLTDVISTQTEIKKPAANSGFIKWLRSVISGNFRL